VNDEHFPSSRVFKRSRRDIPRAGAGDMVSTGQNKLAHVANLIIVRRECIVSALLVNCY
jgi:hypothetical protein